MLIKRESWGSSVWIGKKQIGACVGLCYFAFHGVVMTQSEKRIWRKHGVFLAR